MRINKRKLRLFIRRNKTTIAISAIITWLLIMGIVGGIEMRDEQAEAKHYACCYQLTPAEPQQEQPILFSRPETI